MERMLEKVAKQLCAYDQSSLSQLWPKYEAKVRAFEPTKEWEEAVVIFCIIQAIRMKNQLFNYHLAATVSPQKGEIPPVFVPKVHFSDHREEEEAAPVPPQRKATVLHFPNKKNT